MRSLIHLRLLGVLLALALLAGACGGGEDTTTTDAEAETTTTAEPATTTTFFFEREPLPEIHSCEEIGLFDRQYLFVPVPDPDQGPDPGAAEPDEVERTAGVRLAEPNDDLERYGEALDLVDLRVLDEIGLYYVVENPRTMTALEAINELRAEGIDARPVYGMSLQGHWTMEPGGEPPTEVPDFFSHEVQGAAAAKTVGIVDSGFLVPGMLDQNGQELFPADVSTTMGYEFHGSFVAGIIERIAPGAVGLFGAPIFVQFADWQSDLQEVPPVSDSRAVGAAILEAVGGDARIPAVDVLNISLGTYACPAPKAPQDVAPPGDVERIINKLVQAGVEIFAAGGNEANVPGVTGFYPAGFPGVTGVGAHDINVTDTTWGHYGRDGRVQAAGVSWDTSELGIDVIGLTRPEGGAISWSGSSFATAVASGLAAASPQSGGPVGVCWADGPEVPVTALAFDDCM